MPMTPELPAGAAGRVGERSNAAAPRRWRRSAIRAAACFALVGIAAATYLGWTRPRSTSPAEIFRGVTFTCLAANEPECYGLVHVVRVDLAAPGIQLYLTPLDPEAVARGYEYRLAWARDVLQREHLAVVINAALFSSKSRAQQRPGDLARGGETIVADGKVNHIDPNSYLLWFARDLTPHLEFAKPPPAIALDQARWGVGGQGIPLWKGKLREAAANHILDRRTAIGIDSDRRLLWLAVFENASSAGVARFLAGQGALDGILVDGGHSTTMVLSPQAAKTFRTGELLPARRPVATFLGVRAEPAQ